MAQQDLEVFLRERASVFDENLDTSPGSPFDTQIIQPVLRRLGTDPFSLDFFTFAQAKLNQEFPDMATKEGDAITDLLIKTCAVLFDPILREIARVKSMLSLRDPASLTTDEAESLCANIFSERARGTFAKVTCRLYFAQPQSQAINPSNFVTSRGGLHFYPTGVQSIRTEEMLLNQEGSLYYFDVNLLAEKPGDEYNIGPDELVTIANIPAAVRVTNKRKARPGSSEEGAEEFVGRTRQSLTERSLVTLRGINAQVTGTFSEVSRLSVVGFNDPEMQRDIITGGGLGPIIAFGDGAQGVVDGEGIDATRRLDMSADGVDFVALLGAAGEVSSGWVLTVADAFSVAPAIRDLTITRVVATSVIEVAERVLSPSFSGKFWILRKKSITLSGIPGGILFPDSPNGTVSLPDGGIHIGGTTDVHIRGVDFDTSSLTVTALVDDSPALAGVSLNVVDVNGNVSLSDMVLGTDYVEGDSTFTLLEQAKTKQFSLAILEDVGGTAGTYRVISVTQLPAASPILQLDPPPPLVVADLRWRLFDDIDVDLLLPKETRIAGSDLGTIQNTDYAEPAGGVDLDALGVAAGDILRIEDTVVGGSYIVQEVLTPFFNKVRVDRKFSATRSGLTYEIYRANPTGGLLMPLVRVTSVDMLDTAGQPVGSTVPYAKAVDVRSNAFSNFGNGVRVDVRDARLGITGIPLATSSANVSGLLLSIQWESSGVPSVANVVFAGANPISLASIISQINVAMGRTVASIVDTNRLGITPVDGLTLVTGPATAELFGITSIFDFISSRDVRSDSTVWATEVTPPISPDVDVLQVVDGFQVGFYNNPTTDGGLSFPTYSGLGVDHDFYPEARRHIQVGFRSLGTARMYFLEPTSIEVSSDTFFSVSSEVGTLRFFPDPNLSSQRIPALPSGTQPKDGVTTTGTNAFDSASVDFVNKGIRPGDLLHIISQPLRGTVALTDPAVNVALSTLILSLDGAPNKTITFIRDTNSIPITDVTRDGIASQINRAVGKTICGIVTVLGLQYLEFETSSSLIIRSTGTANALLGFSTVVDQNNDSPDNGSYEIESVSVNQLIITDLFGSSSVRQMYRITRPGTQRVISTQMVENKAEAGLYYFDVELVSEGTGNAWNIPAGEALRATGYDADGYYLTTDDANLSFSPAERPRMVLSRSILEVGVSDDPDNATQLSGQNIQINYERTSLVSSVHNFLTAETERVVNASPLARHLTPFFVRADITYTGGSKESVVQPDVEKYIKEVFPNDTLEVSDLEKILSDRGATSIDNPINLLAVVHNFDRSITVERSQSGLNTGRLAAFIPDRVVLTRKTG